MSLKKLRLEKRKHKKRKLYFLSYRPEDVVESGNSGTTNYQFERPMPCNKRGEKKRTETQHQFKKKKKHLNTTNISMYSEDKLRNTSFFFFFLDRRSRRKKLFRLKTDISYGRDLFPPPPCNRILSAKANPNGFFFFVLFCFLNAS